MCLLAIVGAQFYGDSFMALFGSEYREPGGAVLAILVIGLPASSIRSLSSAANRLRRAGWRNFAQHVTYCAVLFVGFSIVHIETGRSLAVCLVVARLRGRRSVSAEPQQPPDDSSSLGRRGRAFGGLNVSGLSP